jgi:hypothetical protein
LTFCLPYALDLIVIFGGAITSGFTFNLEMPDPVLPDNWISPGLRPATSTNIRSVNGMVYKEGILACGGSFNGGITNNVCKHHPFGEGASWATMPFEMLSGRTISAYSIVKGGMFVSGGQGKTPKALSLL